MTTPQKIHFIAIAQPVMHDLAILQKARGAMITGSDSILAEPAKSKLDRHMLAPPATGWFPEKVHTGLDAVILGPEVGRDNPELQKALALKLKVYSYPEFIYSLSIDKQRVVVAGSYGKTMIALLILHVLNFHKRKFDYVVERTLPDLDQNVRLSDAPLVVIEGGDFMASSLDPTPAFLKYHHHIGVISGIEWQQSTAFPTKEEYTKQFTLFESSTPKGGTLIYFDLEPVIAALGKVNQQDVQYIAYKTHLGQTEDGKEFLLSSTKEKYALKITGKHNFQNISAAKEVLKKIGISSEMFYQAIPSFGSNSI